MGGGVNGEEEKLSPFPPPFFCLSALLADEGEKKKGSERGGNHRRFLFSFQPGVQGAWEGKEKLHELGVPADANRFGLCLGLAGKSVLPDASPTKQRERNAFRGVYPVLSIISFFFEIVTMGKKETQTLLLA